MFYASSYNTLWLRLLILFISLNYIPFLFLTAQTPVSIPIDSSFEEKLDVGDKTLIWVDSTKQADVILAQHALSNNQFKPLSALTFGSKFERAKHSYWLCFDVNNTLKDTLTLFFNCDRTSWLDVWQEPKGKILKHYQVGKLVSKAEKQGIFAGKYDIALTLYPQSSNRFYACMRHEASVNSTIKPILFDIKYQLNRIQDYAFYNHLYGGFLAILIFILLLTLFQYLLNWEKAYLFYALYVATTWFHYWRLFLDSDNSIYPDWVFLLSYNYYILGSLAIYISYGLFVNSFLNDNGQFPIIKKIVDFMSIFTLVYLGVHYALTLYSMPLAFQSFYYFRFSLVLVSLYYLFQLFKYGTTLSYYILTGTGFLLIGALGTLIMSLFQFDHFKGLYDYTLLLGQIGILIEFCCFSIGLSIRSRLMIVEQEMQGLKNLQEERDRIASEMHDDLGSGLSTIKFLSEQLKNKELDPQKLNQTTKITQFASEQIEKMSDIIWAMNSRYDTSANLIAYIRSYASNFLETNNIQCHFDIVENLPDLPLSGDKRRNIILCVKESLHNILKHAYEATDVHIRIKYQNSFEISIKDNGKSPIFTTSKPPSGNGLINMTNRMAAIGGQFVFGFDEGKGAVVAFKW